MKALAIGMFKREGSAIMYAEKVLGSTIEDVVVWLNNNVEKKNFIIKEVSRKDTLDVDDIDTAVLEAEAGNSKAENILEKKTDIVVL